jgi:hypothetical protein
VGKRSKKHPFFRGPEAKTHLKCLWTATKVSHGEFELVQQSKKFVPGSLIGVKDIDFVGRPEAETP